MTSASEQPRRKPSILVVDDTPANLLALRAALEPLGMEIVTASSGREALDRCDEQVFAVVLLDVMMPGIDGFETLARMRSVPRAARTPVIFMTAYDCDAPKTLRAYELGAVDFLTKPIDVAILRAKLRAFVEIHEQTETIRDLAEALAIKDRHIGVLAHDLRNPLSAVKMTAQLLARREEPATRAAGERIGRAAMRMEALIDDVLDFALAAAHKLSTRPSRVDLSRLCADLILEFEGIHPAVRFACTVPVETRGSWDIARLQQAVTNLLANAVKYGDGWVGLTLDAAQDTVHIRIENGGEPIDPGRLAKLFDPFERGTNDGRGAGLGLYIVREIAHAHGGEIDVRSEHGLTRFCLSLPRETSVLEGAPAVSR